MEYFLKMKIDRACLLLTTTSQSITQISHSLGFSSHHYFATAFRRHTSLSPTQFRQANTK